MQAQIVEDGVARLVAKGHVFQSHIPGHMVQHLGAQSVGSLRRFVQQAEHPLCRGQGRLQLAHDVGRLVDGAGEFAGIEHEGRDAAHGHQALEVEQGAAHADQGQGQVVDEIDTGAHPAAVIFGVEIGVHRLVVHRVQLADGVLLLAIGRQGLLAGDGLFHKAVELADLQGAAAEQRPCMGGDEAGDQDGQRHGDAKDQHQRGRDGQHHAQASHHRDHAGQHLDQVGGKGGVDGISVIGDAAQDIAGRVGVEIPHRQGGQVVEDIGPHGIRHFAADGDHDDREQIGQGRRSGVEHQHPEGIPAHLGKIHPARAALHAVDGLARQHGGQQRQQVGGQSQGQRQQDPPAEPHQVAAQAGQGRPLVHRLLGAGRGGTAIGGLGVIGARHVGRLLPGQGCCRPPSGSGRSRGKGGNRAAVLRGCRTPGSAPLPKPGCVPHGGWS